MERKDIKVCAIVKNTKHGNLEQVSIQDEHKKDSLSMEEYQTRAMGTCMTSSNNFAYMFYNLLGEVGELTEKVNDYIRDKSLEKTAKQLCGYGLMAKTIRKEPDSFASLNIVSDFDKHLEDFKKSVLLQKELGDIQWQLSGVCTVLSLALEDIARQNLEKLASRQERNKIDGDGDNR